jgi:hypothetical protein
LPAPHSKASSELAQLFHDSSFIAMPAVLVGVTGYDALVVPIV